MGVTVTILEPSDNTTETDYTDFLRHDKEFEMGGRAFDGEADGDGVMYFDDDESVLSPLDDVAKGKRVFVEEDASGSPKAIFVGRIWDREYERPGKKTHRRRSMHVNVVDANMDMAGIIVDQWSRPAEEPYERVQALLGEYLNGTSSTKANPDDLDFGIWGRPSTVIGDAFVNTAGVGADMPANIYTETDPRAVLRECCEWAGYDAFVIANDDRTLDLFFDEPTSTAYTSSLSVSDNLSDVNNTTCFAPWWNVGPSLRLDGSQQGSGVLVVGGNEIRTYHQLGTSVTDTNDKWEFNERTEAVTQGDMNTLASRFAHFREQESRTISCSIMVPTDRVHLIKPGMRVEVKRAYAAGIGGSTYFRAFGVRYIYRTHEFYLVALQLGFPVKLVRRRGPATPLPPTEGVEGTCTRLYFSENVSPINPSASAVWDTDSAGGSHENNLLLTAPDGDYTATSASTSSAGGSGTDVRLGEYLYELPSGLAAIIAAGGATVRMQARARSRYGIGINEASQDNISQLVVRVTTGASTTIRGTAYAGHSLASSVGSAKWPAQSTKVNRVFPPAAASSTLSAVSGTAAGDYLVVEWGYRSFSPGTTGASVAATSDNDTDLPSNEAETDPFNSWIEICSASTSGDSTGDVVNPGEESTGTPGTYAPLGHTHAHGLLAGDSTHMHSVPQVAPNVTQDDSDPTVNDDEGDGYREGRMWINNTSGDVFILSDATLGAAVWEPVGGSGSLTAHNHTTAGGDGGDLDGALIGDFLEFTEASAPSTPATGFARVYAKSDGRIYSMDEGGTEYGPFDADSGGGGGTYLAPAGFPFIADESTDQETTNTTSHVVTLPAGIVSGNLLVLIMALDGVPTISATGWTSITAASNTVAVGTLYRIADGSEGATVTVTSSASEKSETWVGRFEDHHASAAPEGTSVGVGTAGASPNPDPITVTWGSDDNTFVTILAWDLSAGAGIMVDRHQWDAVSVHARSTGATDGVGLALSISYIATATWNPPPFGLDTSEQYTVATVAIRPV